MVACALLVTNNPNYSGKLPAKIKLCHVDGSALDVLRTARDHIHGGMRLANHPLYGNFRPHQQPYRSLLLIPPSSTDWDIAKTGSSAPCLPDAESLHFIEEALQLYQSSVAKSLPSDIPECMLCDCATLDCALMQATIETLY